MSHATSTTPGSPVVLDWWHAQIGPPQPCALCGGLTVCRSPVKDVPCHKACAETWITGHARGPGDLARLIRAYTPGTG